MIDYRYRFPDEGAARAALAEYITTDEEGVCVWRAAGPDHALDPIGALDQSDGFYVNLRTRTPVDVGAEYLVTPRKPKVVWAGDEV